MALANDAALDADGGLIGDPTEVALLEAALARGVDWPHRRGNCHASPSFRSTRGASA